MSFVCKNIKKIRKVNKLNQSQFAELFNLSRSNIGSYEEERAEPKTDLLIKIAKYFSIPIEILITKEITLNDLTHFKNSIHESHLIEKREIPHGNHIPFVPISEYSNYITHYNDKDDILIGSYVNKKFLKTIPTNQPYIIVTNRRIICTHLNIKNEQLLLKSNFEIESIKLIEIEEIWTLIGKYQSIVTPASNTLSEKVARLEQRLKNLENKING